MREELLTSPACGRKWREAPDEGNATLTDPHPASLRSATLSRRTGEGKDLRP